MFDQISSIVQEAAGSIINKHPGVPDKDKQGVTNEAVNSFTQTFQQLTSGGNLQQLSGMFSGDAGSKDAIMNQFSGNFVSNITGKFGINADTAKSLAVSLLPVIVEKLKGMFSGGGFDIGSILGSLGGGQGAGNSGGGLGDALGGLLGGKK